MLQLSLAVSILGMIVSVHLAVKVIFKRKLSESKPSYEFDDSDGLYGEGIHDKVAQKSLARRMSPLASLLRPTEQSELNELKQQLHHAGIRNDLKLAKGTYECPRSC